MVVEVFLILGAIMLLGFFADLLFSKTKIPGDLILILVGVILGPIMGIVQPSFFVPFSALVGTLALIVILFEAGLNLNLFKVLSELSTATWFTLLVFLLSVSLSTAFLHFFFGWGIYHALLLGIVVGGTSSAMIVPLITRLNVKEEVGILLSLESVITDVFCIAGAVVLIELIVTNSFNPSDIIQTLSGTFSTAILAGFAGGLFWINVLKRLSGKPLGYMLTLAVLLVLYSAIELVGGSGAIGVLIFSLVLGNSVEIAKTLRMSGDYSLEKSIKSTQTEIAFFVKTFFFVFLGLIINPSILEVNALAIAVGLLVVLIIARYLGTMILAFVNPLYVQYKKLVTLMMSRGLAAAVLAFLPLNQNPPIVIPYFSEVVFLIIIFTSLLTTFGSYTTRDKEAETVDETPKVISTKRPRISRVD